MTMTDLDAELPPVLRDIAKRLDIEAVMDTPLLVDASRHLGRHVRKPVTVKFNSLGYQLQLPYTEHTNKLNTLAMQVTFGHHTAIFNLVGDQIALLYYTEWQDWQHALPDLDCYMNYETLVAAWSDNNYQLVMRTVLAVALGVDIPARQAVA